VLEYVRRRAHEQSRELDFKDRQRLVGEIVGSARGRSRKGTSQ
jgi:hypothetical protein